MGVIFNEPGLAALLESPNGPVGRYVTQIAEEMVEQARAEVRDYFHTAPSITVDQDVIAQPVGPNEIEVGMRDAGDKARRLADMQIRGTFNWLGRARESTRLRFLNG